MQPAAWVPRRSSMLVALGLTLGLTSAVRAQDSVLNAPAEEANAEEANAERRERPRRTFWLPFGVTSGWLGNGDSNAFVIGGEVSLVWAELDPNANLFHTPTDGSLAIGAVLDAVWVSNPSHFRAMVGAELIGFFGEGLNAGIEVGATFHSRGDAVGFRARGFFTVFCPIDYHGQVAAEAGLLLKLPFRL